MVFEGIKRAFAKLRENDQQQARQLLLEAGVALEVVEQIQAEAKEKDLRSIVFEKLKPLSSPELRSLIDQKRDWPYVMVFFGVNGVGKTTAIAKVGKMLAKGGYKPLIVPADTFRAGAIEQLITHATRLNLPYVQSRYGADPASLVFEAKKATKGKERSVVLVDTAGRVELDKNLMDQMKKIIRVAQPDLKVLVLDALTGNAVTKQVEAYDSAVGVDAFIITKTDADQRGGIFLSVSRYKKPVLFVSSGQDYDSLYPFKPDEWVDSILPKRGASSPAAGFPTGIASWRAPLF